MSVELPVNDLRLFQTAVSLLQDFQRASPLLAPNFGVAVAALIHRGSGHDDGLHPPRLLRTPLEGEPVTTHELQVEVCDPTFEKLEEFMPVPAQGPIYKPFTYHFKGRSPRVNNWRNSFDLQSGLGCDAPYSEDFLRSPHYLSEQRFHCVFRDAETGRCNSTSGLVHRERTCFNSNKRGRPPGPESTRALPRPKLLTRGRNDGVTGYWYVEPTTEVLVDLLADPADRVPVYPFAVALYGGSAYFGQWGDLASRERLQRDLQLDDERFAALFDVTHANPLNQAVLDAAGIHVEAPPALPVEFPDRPRVLSSPVPYRFRTPTTVRRRLEQVADPERRAQLLERATYGHAKTLQALATFLRERGFTCREQLDGFDLLATADGQACLFEVKTWRRENLARQARAALAQLLEYQYRNRDILPDDVSLYMVLDRQPPRDLWLWEFLAQECGIVTCWISDGVLKTWEGRLFE